MPKQFFKTSIILCLSLFILSGCGKEDPVVSPLPVEIDNETVVPSTPAQQAHAYCVSNGFKLIIERSEIVGPELFCEFPNGSRCPAGDFLNEICKPDTALVVTNPTTTAALNDIFTSPRFCNPVAIPVCGANGRTYSNACMAEQQGIYIQYEGTCDPSIEPTNPPTVYDPNPNKKVKVQETQSANSGSGANITPSNKGNNSTVGNSITYKPETVTVNKQVDQTPIYTDTNIPDWIAVPFSLIDGNQSVTEAWVEKCNINGKIYYLQVENCESCFSSLYNDSGTLICNPSNDINNSCPANFSNVKPNNCTFILRK